MEEVRFFQAHDPYTLVATLSQDGRWVSACLLSHIYPNLIPQ